jgi:hypothetical protein
MTRRGRGRVHSPPNATPPFQMTGQMRAVRPRTVEGPAVPSSRKLIPRTLLTPAGFPQHQFGLRSRSYGLDSATATRDYPLDFAHTS